MPDGRRIVLKQSLTLLKPWEVDWDQEPEVATALIPNWKYFLKLAIALPAIAWLLAEIAVAALNWVKKGFRAKNAA